jgi:hypothetical protein
MSAEVYQAVEHFGVRRDGSRLQAEPARPASRQLAARRRNRQQRPRSRSGDAEPQGQRSRHRPSRSGPGMFAQAHRVSTSRGRSGSGSVVVFDSYRCLTSGPPQCARPPVVAMAGPGCRGAGAGWWAGAGCRSAATECAAP